METRSRHIHKQCAERNHAECGVASCIKAKELESSATHSPDNRASYQKGLGRVEFTADHITTRNRVDRKMYKMQMKSYLLVVVLLGSLMLPNVVEGGKCDWIRWNRCDDSKLRQQQRKVRVQFLFIYGIRI